MDNKKLLATIEKLRQVRTRDDLKAPPSKILKTELSPGVPLTLRQYQVQGILHLLAMPRFVLGDDTGLGKTLQTIAAISYLWDKKPDLPALICTTKSAVGQWESEFDRFTTGVKVFKLLGTKKKRALIHEEFQAYNDGPKVMVMGYRTAIMDFQYLQSMVGHIMVFDEATAFKNDTSQIHQVCKHLAGSAERVWSLSATIIKNRLMEAWAIYKVTVPDLFTSKNAFMREYCITRDQPIGGGRKIKVVVGHRKHDIEAFRNVIDPYFIGRPKHLVAQELPPLTTNIIECELTKVQREKYKEALDGLLESYNEKTGEVKEREVSKLTAVTVCQQITNHPALVDIEGDSGKLEALLDLLDNELEGEKVIIFSRFRQMVDILEAELAHKKIKSCRITGAEDGDARVKSQKLFQDPDSGVPVCLITMAAAEGVNLQLAKAVIFYDTPWSAGDYLQIVGRMIRIGSIHDRVFGYHIVAPKTIDERVMKTLKDKMNLIESVLGKRLKSEGEEDEAIIEIGQSEIADLFDGLLDDAKLK